MERWRNKTTLGIPLPDPQEQEIGAALAQNLRPKFPRRHNSDGTIESICTSCFATVATVTKDTDLQAAEDAHIFPGLDLSRILYPPPER